MMARVSLSAEQLRTQMKERMTVLQQQRQMMDGEIAQIEKVLKSLGDADWHLPSLTLEGVAGRYAPASTGNSFLDAVNGSTPRKRVRNGKKGAKRGRPTGS